MKSKIYNDWLRYVERKKEEIQLSSDNKEIDEYEAEYEMESILNFEDYEYQCWSFKSDSEYL